MRKETYMADPTKTRPEATTTRADLSAVVIIRNEARNLPGLITTLKDWVREIVLVDDNSTDGGVDIALSSGAPVRLVSHKMTSAGGFAAQRNAGISAATGTWLLHMDCDERVTPELAIEISAAIAGSNMNAFCYRRTNYFLHRRMLHGGWSGWNRPQIARRGAHRFEGLVHESCVVDGGEVRIGQIHAPMLHLNDPSFSYRLHKSAKYVAIEKDRRMASGRRATGIGILSRSILEFFKKYVAKMGFRDGTPGLIAAMHSATSEFRTEAILWDEQNQIARHEIEEKIAIRWTRAGSFDNFTDNSC